MKKIVIAGAGPAGLTAALSLLRRGAFDVTLLEARPSCGGIARTISACGCRMDIGGHRFFTKSERVSRFWESLLQMQRIHRLSQILFDGKLIDYPVSMSASTLMKLGLGSTASACAGYMRASLFPRAEASLEDFYINRFGEPLYKMFFESYTEKVWGRHPSRISADWGAQRVKGLSLLELVRDMAATALGLKGRKKETSLIDEFLYPPLGPGQLWQAAADEIAARGGKFVYGARVESVAVRGGAVRSVDYIKDGNRFREDTDVFISSMPLKDFVLAVRGEEPPASVRNAAAGLMCRDFMTAGVLVRGAEAAAALSDNWIYVQSPDVKLGRMQFFGNWSRRMAEGAPDGSLWLGLEYFCDRGGPMWNMRDEDFLRMAGAELASLPMSRGCRVTDGHVERAAGAYPAYFEGYEKLPMVRDYAASLANAFCVGRGGQHRYNNMDHSMLTAMIAADIIIEGCGDRRAVWEVNAELEYHEKG